MATWQEMNNKVKQKTSITEEVLEEMVYKEPEVTVTSNTVLSSTLEVAIQVQRLNTQIHIDKLMARYDELINALNVTELEDFVKSSNEIADKVFGTRG